VKNMNSKTAFSAGIGVTILSVSVISIGIKVFVPGSATPPGQPTAADLLQMQNDKAAIKEGVEQQMKADQEAELLKQRKQLLNRY
jgi:formylmethanofuran:tetrahydromethanopterin formyltransferase